GAAHRAAHSRAIQPACAGCGCAEILSVKVTAMKWMTRLHCNPGAIVLALASWNACAANAGLVQRGRYLATAGDCIACHTAPGGRAMAGGLALPTPLGTIVSTNITPSKTYGIGNYTQAQFSAALR